MNDTTRRGERALRQRLRTTSCSDCEHPWEEHAGSADDAPTTCSECRYEADHDQVVDGRPLCRDTVPAAVIAPPPLRGDQP
ncbi:hypothetical protein ES689_06310 [Frigoribacterium sp. ACAM 257]|uniref:hypothetical protein n=1 Tax=Frigoribacterium sp. ACAM 257 TaxID=2508998 RepID=UPI0011B9C203|nr:hypothetical protein [Frigoribacterium sp. ACAM 257]TWX38284.1 hypothetical protein ES689_06310 [Frigoribacterium sp. ACAM 257]